MPKKNLKRRYPLVHIWRNFFYFCFLSLFIFTASCSSQKPSEKKITVWHLMIDRKAAFDEIAKKYKEQTGLTIEFNLFFPQDLYTQKVIACARAGTLPDIFSIIGEKKTLASFVQVGQILDLTPYMDENNMAWKESFYPQALEVVSFHEKNHYDVTKGIYGVPIDTTVLQFVCNLSLWKQLGFDENSLPKTFDEFLSAAQKAKQLTGVYGFVCGWAEDWLINCLAIQWAINLMGEEKFLQTIEGKVPYTDEQWIEVFSLFEKIREAGILAPNMTTLINKEAENIFAQGKALFAFNGSWAINVYQQLSPDLDYTFFALPRVSDKFPVKIWGGAGFSFMVNPKSPYKEEIIAFLKWFTAKEQQEFLIEKTNNLPAIKNCENVLSPKLKPLAAYFDSFTHPSSWPYNEDSRVIEVMNSGLMKIVMGVKKPREVAQEIQDVKERISRQ